MSETWESNRPGDATCFCESPRLTCALPLDLLTHCGGEIQGVTVTVSPLVAVAHPCPFSDRVLASTAWLHPQAGQTLSCSITEYPSSPPTGFLRLLASTSCLITFCPWTPDHSHPLALQIGCPRPALLHSSTELSLLAKTRPHCALTLDCPADVESVEGSQSIGKN